MVSETWQNLLLAFVVFEWIVRFVMLFIVPKNRQPSSANAWLLLIMIVPSVGALFYMMFGQPKLPKVRRQLQADTDKMTAKELKSIQKRTPALTSLQLAPAFASIEKLVSALGGLPAMNGNKTTYFTDYHEFLAQMVRCIDDANNYVHLEFFIFVLDEETEEIFRAMERAIDRGVVVRVLFDRFATRYYPNYKNMIKRLNAMGAQWYLMLPYSIIPGKNFTRPDLRNHRKIVIVDGVRAMTGSANVVRKNYHRKDDLYYEDMMVLLEGPAVWQCNNVFRADWYAETRESLLDLVEDIDMPEPSGTTVLQLLPSGPSHSHENNHMLYTTLFHVAQKRISIVVPYFVPDESVITAIIAAAKRGVKVTIINSEIIDKLLTGHAQRSYYEQLLDAGVEIYLYEKPVFLHTKQVLIDDEVAVIGSSNLDIRSFELDLELSMVVYGSASVKQLARSERKYIERSQLVDKDVWARRPILLKLLDNIARLTASIQ